jgi:hypothetical protein
MKVQFKSWKKQGEAWAPVTTIGEVVQIDPSGLHIVKPNNSDYNVYLWEHEFERVQEETAEELKKQLEHLKFCVRDYLVHPSWDGNPDRVKMRAVLKKMVG